MMLFKKFLPLLVMSVMFGFATFPGVGLIIPPGTAYFIPLISAIFVIGLLLPGWSEQWRSLILSALIGLAFALTLRDIISHALPTRWIAWGVIPINDAHDFVNNALEFLARGEFYTPRGRVFSPVFYAGLINLSNFNIRTVMWICAMMAAISTLCAVLNTRSVLGFTASGIVAFILIDFAHEHIGGLSSEMPGYIYGLGGFSGIIIAARSGSKTSFIIGFLLLSMAMAIRIGAVFILPAILIWAWVWLPPLWNRRWLIPVMGVLTFIAVFWFNGIATRVIAPASGSSFVNAIDSWYAVIVEGELALGRRNPADVISQTRWVQIYRDHPEITIAPTVEQPRIKKKIFFETVKRSPDAVAIGSLIELKRYIINKDIFNFVDVKPIKYLIFLIAILGGIAAFYETYRNRQPIPALITFVNLAIVLSQPFLYGGEHRASAPIIGFTALLPAYGMVVLIKWLTVCNAKVLPEIDTRTGYFINIIATTLCITGLAICVYGFVISGHGRYTTNRQQKSACPSGLRFLNFYYSPSSGLYIGPAKTSKVWPAPSLTPEKLSATHEWLRKLPGRYSRWIYTPFDMSEEKHMPALRAANISPAGVLLFNTINLETCKPLFVAVSAPPLDQQGPSNACIDITTPDLIHMQPIKSR
ncbi:MAG: hypothetical protein EHM45_05080 [Desulfobacteraceae bacterium]|nr:MAG: hypothetical protein EHM45_05080 [Desulfobacteraceae bacterium]